MQLEQTLAFLDEEIAIHERIRTDVLPEDLARW